MYMIPSRRAIANLLPWASVAVSQASTSLTSATWLGLWIDTFQSKARPSLCSLWPPPPQSTTIP